VEPFPDLSTLSDDALADLVRRLELEEDDVSRRRRLLHGRIDVLRGERIERLRAQVETGSVELHTPESLERPVYAGTGEVPASDELTALPDLATLDDDELRAAIRDLEHEEDDISLRRRFLQGQIDILRAERAKRSRGRGDAHVDPGELGAILGGREVPDGSR
jgi:RsiG-like